MKGLLIFILFISIASTLAFYLTKLLTGPGDDAKDILGLGLGLEDKDDVEDPRTFWAIFMMCLFMISLALFIVTIPLVSIISANKDKKELKERFASSSFSDEEWSVLQYMKAKGMKIPDDIYRNPEDKITVPQQYLVGCGIEYPQWYLIPIALVGGLVANVALNYSLAWLPEHPYFSQLKNMTENNYTFFGCNQKCRNIYLDIISFILGFTIAYVYYKLLMNCHKKRKYEEYAEKYAPEVATAMTEKWLQSLPRKFR